MKRLLLLISFTILFLYSFTQTDVQRDSRVNPVLKEALASKSGYYIYGRTVTARFINMAVLNQSSHVLCWFTCHGRLFDSTKLTVQEFEQVTSKQLDPFVLYHNICDKYLADIAAAKDIYRLYGDMQQFDKLNGNYRALFAMETVQAAKTPLQKLIAIENVRKKMLTQLAYLNCGSPFGLHNDPLYKISKDQAGVMIQTNDSTVYYNIDPTSAVAKIILYKRSAGQLYIQNRFSEVIDSVAIQPEKHDLLQKEKTDVFLLYRGWLELQWQGVLAAIRRQGAGLCNQVSAQSEKENKELYSQFNAIGAKINLLNSPEAKSIEQAVYDTYKSETSEIAYMPLLGIAYTLIQARGVKEYELTNHLGNVLATVTDKKIGVPSSSNSSLIDHYEPDIVSAQDYYPFGMLQPGRSYLSPNGDKYRYGFNDKENDNEVKGEGNQQDYGMRVYDPRLGRFLSVDPLTKKYPELTPYQFASNTPIQAIDLDGLEMVSPSAYAEDKKPMQGVQKAAGITLKFTYGTAASVMNWVDRVNPWNVSEERMNQNEQATGALVHAVANPAQTVKNIKKSIFDWKNNLIYGDPETSGRAFGSFLGFVGDVAMIKGLGSGLIANYEGNQIINRMLKDGVKIIVAASEDDINYLREIGGQALYMSGEAGEGASVLVTNTSRPLILEEAIHHEQVMKYGMEYVQDGVNRIKLEIEAQERLLKIGKKEGWTAAEMSEIQKAKETWTQQLKEATTPKQ